MRAAQGEGLDQRRLPGAIHRHVVVRSQIQRSGGGSFLSDGQLVGIDVPGDADGLSVFREDHVLRGVDGGRSEVDAQCGAREVEDLPINGRELDFKMTFELIQIERAAGGDLAECFSILGKGQR